MRSCCGERYDGRIADLVDDGAYLEMETAQIKGVDSTKRRTDAVLKAKSTLIIHEKKHFV